MQPILDLTPFEGPQYDNPQDNDTQYGGQLPPAAAPVEEYDDDYLYSPFAGIAAFLTGRVDVTAVRATFRSAAPNDQTTGAHPNGLQQLADLLDDTCLGRVA